MDIKNRGLIEASGVGFDLDEDHCACQDEKHCGVHGI